MNRHRDDWLERLALWCIVAAWLVVALTAVYAFGESLGYWWAMEWWRGCAGG